MASSRFHTVYYSSEHFVESAGAVPFDLAAQKVCVLRMRKKNHCVLAKGRRNCGETRQQAALREVREETGYQCSLLPVTMLSRAPPAIEITQSRDTAREYENCTEPFSVQIRHMGNDSNLKIIWWYIAKVEREEPIARDPEDEERSSVEFLTYDQAMKRLTFETDRDVVKKAIECVKSTYSRARSHPFESNTDVLLDGST